MPENAIERHQLAPNFGQRITTAIGQTTATTTVAPSPKQL
jgi:hypothetical protein